MASVIDWTFDMGGDMGWGSMGETSWPDMYWET